MLKPEAAKARLAEWRLPEGEHRLAAAVKQLPEQVRTPIEILCGWSDEAKANRLEAHMHPRRCRVAAVQLDRAAAKDRAELFRLISPHLAAPLEAAWQLLKTTPYQAGYERKAFRAPSRPDATLAKRGDWLARLAWLANEYPAETLTSEWLAAWAPHLASAGPFGSPGNYASEIGVLLAGVLSNSSGDADAVFEVLRQSLSNQHEVGGMGRHVITACLLSDRPEGWELIEKTLLAAQRQEGLRQAILECVDMSHPEAFRRMLRLILDHDLIRFSATVRAADVWFGQLWAAASAGVVKKMLTQVVEFLEQPQARDKALAGKDAEAAFLALWCTATEDAVASVAPAQKLLRAKSVELRYVAARHLANLGLDVASAALAEALEDADLRVALLALHHHDGETDSEAPAAEGRFEKIERLLERVPPKPQTLQPLVWPWNEIRVYPSQVAWALMAARGDRPAARLIPHLPKMETYLRRDAAALVLAEKPWPNATRQVAFDLAASGSSEIREVALRALLDETLQHGEVERLESYLTRKTGDLRHGVLRVLLKQSDADALASAARLLDSKDAQQRLAGLELLRLLVEAGRSAAECRRQAAAYRQGRKKLLREELAHLDEFAKDKTAAAVLEDALGLMNPADRTPVVAPQNRRAVFVTAAAVECLKSLDALVHEHRETSIHYKALSFSSEQEELLGNVRWGFPGPDWDKPREGQAAKLPLAEIWSQWFQDRGKKLRDADGWELVRARVWLEICSTYHANDWNEWGRSDSAHKAIAKTISGGQGLVELRYERLVDDLIDWLLFLHPADVGDYLLDAMETAWSLVPAADMQQLAARPKPKTRRLIYGHDDDERADWREALAFSVWPDALENHQRLFGCKLNPAQQVRWWRLLHWRDEPFAGAARMRPEGDLMFAAYEQGAASLADIADHLLGPRGAGRYNAEGFGLLAALTSRKRAKGDEAFLARRPEVKQLVDRAVERILELELSRGDAPTAATAPAYFIDALYGTETLRRILRALGKAEFKLGVRWKGVQEDRRETLTQLAKSTYPAADEPQDAFVRQMREAIKAGEFPEERLLQLAFLAPQWTKFIQSYLGWKAFDEGVYWFLAHMQYVGSAGENAALAGGVEEPAEEADEAETGDADDENDAAAPKPRKLSAWERLIVERTPLTGADRAAGAIDVQWFRRTHQELGPKHWQALAQAARFAATPAQAKRARFVGDVLLNQVKRQELVTGIKKKQLKEHVRLLGLLPLAGGAKREADLRERCQILREYRRYANTLSGLTKPDALRAWEIGMKNLAQTAGFADPLRLEWAVGAEAVKDLAKGPVSVTKNGITVALSLDEQSQPVLAVHNGPKELKSIPPAIKKDKQVAELAARATDLRRQASSARQSLEAAMCRGDAFTGEELRQWCGHALPAPLLARLVIVGEGVMGYPDKGGKALRDYAGKLEPVKPKETLRLAHSHDLFAAGQWDRWQRECFQAECVQPFKQVFRELYVLTKQEKKDGEISHRYDGQQVQPKQALALFGARGWNTGEGVFKVFHDQELTVDVSFETGVTTPAEVEGWAVAGISFRRRDEWKPIKLAAVPPRLFSEVMRDLDLVVSVAHAGGVDPEASASTVEMRAGLVRETCALLQLKNVRLKNNHALIDGELGDYSVHLGSGVVHRMPGGAVCIVPVHAQQRGRLFLPFADDDPRTAEVVSKVLLLARDREIQDPAILEQLRA